MERKQSDIKAISAEEFDRRFDAVEELTEYIDWSTMRRPDLEIKRVNVDLPQHVIDRLDRAARLWGITRQALIKVLLFDAIRDSSKAL
jgi:hypothetical protein